MKRLLEIVCVLEEHELGVQGHTEDENSSNRGKYVYLINLLSKYDETLKVHLQQPTIFKGTSTSFKTMYLFVSEK